jgi:hypothetical protein
LIASYDTSGLRWGYYYFPATTWEGGKSDQGFSDHPEIVHHFVVLSLSADKWSLITAQVLITLMCLF